MRFLISSGGYILLLLSGFFCNAQSLDSLDLSYKYYQGKGFEYESRIYLTGGDQKKASIFIQITNLSSAEKDLAFATSTHKSLNERVPEEINYSKSYVLEGGKTLHIKLEQLIDSESQWLLLSMKINNLMYPDLFLIDERSIFTSPEIFPTLNASEDNTSTYFKSGDIIKFNNLENIEGDSLVVYHMNYNFNPAYPPMFETFNQSEGDPQNIRTFKVAVNSDIELDSTGLYQYKLSEGSLNAQGFRVENEYFPKPRTVEALIGPLRYISSNKEYSRLDSIASKQALDEFFLKVFGSPQKAKAKIKLYYNRVSKANYHFTNYKEGWKTDQGLIFIILGAPANIKKEGNYEIWTYKNGFNSSLSFTFVQVKNPYTGYHFILIRKKEYENDWFNAIDAWRGR
ncbi:GWxTD domain-containing protein [Marinigracilibium pacificum]|uniref:GWxTD domain-containing protein n=1 Tax=Marinigracilibium pacificum TaxID=2729599 RepID=A0A848IWE6_9BACT|nr:GWxTD domain-containing protein [Marinigracilibium pacificum]NMM48843.1 GWxTD domain-containing protein [Marinigracilibium pacificum]